eukprot:NODE_6748_length_1642_cov_6.402640.p1 GENE.NODE_6748_length_1642_cov_6.402640~~NODE_6748_length_1642_cov_6.402640.p1  ORF type:complete len:254 (-),score=21.21 NODE_6748_length_1642_cov_6.402640:426-1187(-)
MLCQGWRCSLSYSAATCGGTSNGARQRPQALPRWCIARTPQRCCSRPRDGVSDPRWTKTSKLQVLQLTLRRRLNSRHRSGGAVADREGEERQQHPPTYRSSSAGTATPGTPGEGAEGARGAHTPEPQSPTCCSRLRDGVSDPRWAKTSKLQVLQLTLRRRLNSRHRSGAVADRLWHAASRIIIASSAATMVFNMEAGCLFDSPRQDSPNVVAFEPKDGAICQMQALQLCCIVDVSVGSGDSAHAIRFEAVPAA